MNEMHKKSPNVIFSACAGNEGKLGLFSLNTNSSPQGISVGYSLKVGGMPYEYSSSGPSLEFGMGPSIMAVVIMNH
jgi:hypothetical protein